MSQVENFLSTKDEQDIVEAILEAEKNTSGEIRVHIESHTQEKHFNRAREVFYLLKMDNTKQKNGVLLYIAVKDKTFVIYGDEGINQVVPPNFWNTTKDTIQNRFKEGNYKQGIIDGILAAGKELKIHFPWQNDTINELSNEVSKKD